VAVDGDIFESPLGRGDFNHLGAVVILHGAPCAQRAVYSHTGHRGVTRRQISENSTRGFCFPVVITAKANGAPTANQPARVGFSGLHDRIHLVRRAGFPVGIVAPAVGFSGRGNRAGVVEADCHTCKVPGGWRVDRRVVDTPAVNGLVFANCAGGDIACRNGNKGAGLGRGLSQLIVAPAVHFPLQVQTAAVVGPHIDLGELNLGDFELVLVFLSPAAPPAGLVQGTGDFFAGHHLIPSTPVSFTGIAKIGALVRVVDSRVNFAFAGALGNAVWILAIGEAVSIIVLFVHALSRVVRTFLLAAAAREEAKADGNPKGKIERLHFRRGCGGEKIDRESVCFLAYNGLNDAFCPRCVAFWPWFFTGL
jgi:hypothetical protein